ncbi:hypothetical protein TcYC6_0028850 [Trypanosoma cruzi]|nr:hypothetical protein TcYC6_0028850 [Trypanosoma cruzi]
MGKTWTEAVGILLRVPTDAPNDPYGRICLLGSFITTTIEGNNLMLYTQKGRYSSGEHGPPNAFYVWVTDNNRTFRAGPLPVDDDGNMALTNTLLYSDGALYLVEARGIGVISKVYFARLTEELEMIRSVVRAWALLDAFFSELSIPTAGLVGYLSNAASGNKWMDDYLCMNAIVTNNAVRVANGFKFTGPGSGAVWPVNSSEDNGPYTLVSHQLTIVATVVIHETTTGGGSNPLLGAVLDAPFLSNFSEPLVKNG